MKKSSLVLLASLALFISCGSSDDKEKKEDFFPVDAFLKSQIAQVDTTLNTIRQFLYIDSSRTDTIYIRRENFRAVAKDFIGLPDISASKYSDRYTETKQFDESINRVLLVYTPVKPEQELIQRQEVLIQPDPAAGDKIKTIIINTSINTKDSAVQKRMLWQVDKSFQVVTIKQLPGQPETTTTTRVVWNEE